MSIESTLALVPEGTAPASLRAADIAAGPVRALFEGLDARGMVVDSLQVVRHGELALDYWRWPHTPTRRHTLHSATKSFVATAVGFAIAEGLLRLDDEVAPFFEGRFPEPPSENMRRMRIRDLLTMQTGNTREISGATTRRRVDGWINDFLEEPVELPPGTHFQYSSMSSHALSAIVTKLTGLPVDEYLVPRLFAPLGIVDYGWQRDPEGISSGGNGLSVRSVDLLKFGVLYLQDGVWDGRRILPERWAEQVSFPHVPSTHGRGGYGFQFWTFPERAYNAEGRFGQYCLVMPADDAVITATSSIGEGLYNDLTLMLLDEFGAGFAAGAAGSSAEEETWVADRVTAARETLPLPTDPGPIGTLSYRFDPNDRGLETIRITTEPDAVVVTLVDERGEHEIRHGLGTWVTGRTGVSVWRLHHSYQDDDAVVLAGAAWTGDELLTLRWLFAESPFEDTVALRFEGDRVTLRHGSNINSSETELPPVSGVRLPS